MACVIPLAISLWNFAWPPLRLQVSLRMYPDAKEISRAFTSLDTNTGYQVLYYWTPVPLDNVQNYYETFALPLIEHKTIFQPYGDELDAVNVENRLCDYQKYSCLEVSLIGFGVSEVVGLPNIISERGFDHTTSPSPVSTVLTGGTLIVYSYFTDEW